MSMGPEDHSGFISQVALEMADATGEDETGEVAIRRVLGAVPDADLASLTMTTRRGQLRTLAASSAQARDLDDLQYALGQGPCVEAATEGDWFRTGDLALDGRWPSWGPAAAGLGVGSLLSLRLNIAQKTVGALNLYSYTPGRFADRDELDFALVFAAHIAIALTAARNSDNLTIALHSRHAIGIAQGILIARYGLTIDQSFDLLRRYSTTTNTKISALAQQIISTGHLPESHR